MKKSLFFIAAALFAGLQLTAQITEKKRCGEFEAVQERDKVSPGYANRVDAAFSYAKQIAEANKANRGASDTVYRIRCVFHVVYTNAGENIPDSLIYNQLDILNRDYRRLNADTVQTREVFQPFAADAGIEFYLADTDPSGNPTTGITRSLGSPAIPFLGFSINDEVKKASTGGVDAWPTDKYLNIWVCNLFGGIVLGYAYPPSNAPNWDASQFADSVFQGVVLHYGAVGEGNPAAIDATVDGGRSAVHEIGHYLGLRHIWGDGDCSLDDGINDTPDADAASQQACDTSKNTCVESPVDYPDMIENYMDYSDDRCLNMFTHEQVGIMRAMLQTSRAGIATTSVVSGINKEEAFSSVQLFPNPSTGLVTLKVYADGGEKYSYEVFNAIGEKLAVAGNGMFAASQTIDLSNQPTGIYMVRISSGNKVTYRKLQLVRN